MTLQRRSTRAGIGSVIIGGDNSGHISANTNVILPPAVRRVLLVLLGVVLVGVFGWGVDRWVLPIFAPAYQTLFLIDTADTDGSGALYAVADALTATVGNAADQDALALRSFGGSCGASDNTSRLVGFGTGNSDEIRRSVEALPARGDATLLRGIVQAADDFAGPFTQWARQVDRVVVVTRHSADACDQDTAFVENEIRSRIGSAGLDIDFRLIGYEIPAAEQPRLNRIAAAAGAPPALFANDPAELTKAMDWVVNSEPVLRAGSDIVGLLNTTVEKVNAAVAAMTDGREDVAREKLDEARDLDVGDRLRDIHGRADTPQKRDVADWLDRLVELQQRVVDDATELTGATRPGPERDIVSSRFRTAVETYNSEARALTRAIDQFRAGAPKASE